MNKTPNPTLSYSFTPDTSEMNIAGQRYAMANTIINQVITLDKNRVTLSDKIDNVVLNKFLGLPIFLFAMYIVFWLTMSVGGGLIDFFDILFGAIFVDGFSLALEAINMPNWLIAIAANGVGTGVQTVATFIPIVFTLFLCLAILEDSGYIARAAVVVDRFMQLIGLPGKSFVPMLVGFGCTVPAIMACRTLSSKRDRILTVFMTPFMSCGAKLPVYALFGAAFFGANASLMVFSLYLTGGVLAILTGLLMRHTVFKGKSGHFVMELPPYHAPHIKSIFISAGHRLKGFVFGAGKIIIVAVTILSFLNSIGTDGSFGNENSEKSVMATIGTAITPVFQPLGMSEENWPAAVALLTGLMAKETVVATLNSLYSQMGNNGAELGDEKPFSLATATIEALKTIPENLLGGWAIFDTDIGVENAVFSNMHIYFSGGVWQVYAYLIFVLLYMPCMAAAGTIIREIGYKFGFILFAYLMFLAWTVATLVYQITLGRNIFWIVFALGLILAMVLGLRLLGKIWKNELIG
jgi:ferrous iron transport protein B